MVFVLLMVLIVELSKAVVDERAAAACGAISIAKEAPGKAESPAELYFRLLLF